MTGHRVAPLDLEDPEVRAEFLNWLTERAHDKLRHTVLFVSIVIMLLALGVFNIRQGNGYLALLNGVVAGMVGQTAFKTGMEWREYVRHRDYVVEQT